MMYHLTRFLRWCALSAFLLALCVASPAARFAHADNPCSQASGDPGDPAPPPEPDIAGIVDDVGESAPVAGATMQLYRCYQGEGTYVTSVATSSSGYFAFWDLTEAFYYVQAALTGPLAGKSPAAGTVNPSDAVPVGDGDRDLDFSFE
jgi:hypothetical protein